jgi:predicted SAM-dependent methyltransferase
LDFAEDESFDFVYAQSVFTHIPLELQKPWIMELRRILRPEGMLICNVIGSYHTNVMLNAEEQATLARDGHLTLDAKHPRASYSTQVIGSWDIFQRRDEVRKAFGAAFDILDYGMGQGLDLLILRR